MIRLHKEGDQPSRGFNIYRLKEASFGFVFRWDTKTDIKIWRVRYSKVAKRFFFTRESYNKEVLNIVNDHFKKNINEKESNL